MLPRATLRVIPAASDGVLLSWSRPPASTRSYRSAAVHHRCSNHPRCCGRGGSSCDAAAHRPAAASHHATTVRHRHRSAHAFSKSTYNTTTSPAASAASAPQERLLVLGSGVAGCAAALTAARHGRRVTVLHAGSAKEDCNSYWAQGGVIYRNYRLREEEGDGGPEARPPLVDTPLSLVNDIRIASGYTAPLQRSSPLEEGTYSTDLVLNDDASAGGKRGRTCPTSGVHWNEDAAWKLACEGPARVRELLLGSQDDGRGEAHGCVVPFDRTAGDGGDAEDVLSLCLEASHAAPRIIHYADCTGKAITEGITRAASAHPLIEFVGDAVVTDLLVDEGEGGGAADEAVVIGARVLDKRTNQLSSYYAVHGTVLASGGLAGIYQHSTNPLGFNALGSSVGLALRLEDRLAGSGSARDGIVSDLEYVQFHPTALYLPGEARFLLTEALRGEGAILRDADGRAFARDYHPNGELAPRDIVARAVFSESQKGAPGDAHNAYLDISHRDPAWLRDRFPSIHAHLGSRDPALDFTAEHIPVIPAAHYTCGGVTTDLHGRVLGGGGAGGGWHRGLYAAGEAARTGLHGGNRLASTSLLEGLVFGAAVGEGTAGADEGAGPEEREVARDAVRQARHAIERRLATEQTTSGEDGHDGRSSREATALLAHLKAVMWDNVGVVRTPAKLAVAVSELTDVREQAERLWKGGAGWEAAALRDAAHAGLAVADAALANRVSGGAHFVELAEGEGGGESEERESDDEGDVLLATRA